MSKPKNMTPEEEAAWKQRKKEYMAARHAALSAPREPVQCLVCGLVFVPKDKRQVTCSNHPRSERQAARDRLRYADPSKRAEMKEVAQKRTNSPEYFIPRDCVICGESFMPRNKNNVVCKNHEAKERRAAIMFRWLYPDPSEFAARNCVICNQEFRPRTRTQLTCTNHTKVQRQNGIKSWRYHQTLLPPHLRTRQCLICGTGFLPRLSGKPQRVCGNHTTEERKRALGRDQRQGESYRERQKAAWKRYYHLVWRNPERRQVKMVRVARNRARHLVRMADPSQRPKLIEQQRMRATRYHASLDNLRFLQLGTSFDQAMENQP